MNCFLRAVIPIEVIPDVVVSIHVVGIHGDEVFPIRCDTVIVGVDDALDGVCFNNGKIEKWKMKNEKK